MAWGSAAAALTLLFLAIVAFQEPGTRLIQRILG